VRYSSLSLGHIQRAGSVGVGPLSGQNAQVKIFVSYQLVPSSEFGGILADLGEKNVREEFRQAAD
jgi:hypothetical protein